jgi:hypothetical protein
MNDFDVVSDPARDNDAAARRHGRRSTDFDNGTAARSFRRGSGEAEHFVTVEAPATLSLEDQIATLQERYEAAQVALGLAPETAVFRRLYLSDVLNQANLVRASALVVEPLGSPVAVSIVQQPPMGGAKIALMAYHIEGQGSIAKRRLSPTHVLVEKNGLRHLWSTGLCAGADDPSESTAAQTTAIFDDLIATLASQGATLRDDCVRTWLYVKDVDVFYAGWSRAAPRCSRDRA